MSPNKSTMHGKSVRVFVITNYLDIHNLHLYRLFKTKAKPLSFQFVTLCHLRGAILRVGWRGWQVGWLIFPVCNSLSFGGAILSVGWWRWRLGWLMVWYLGGSFVICPSWKIKENISRILKFGPIGLGRWMRLPNSASLVCDILKQMSKVPNSFQSD